MSVFYGRLRQRKQFERQDSSQLFSRQSSFVEAFQVNSSDKNKDIKHDGESILHNLFIILLSFFSCIIGRLYSSTLEQVKIDRKEWVFYQVVSMAIKKFTWVIKCMSDTHGVLLEVTLWLPLVVMASYIVFVENGQLVFYP